MLKLLKQRLLITIVLLSCFIPSLESRAENDTIPFTGELSNQSPINDSVYIAYSDLRTVNSKLIELKYEKEINSKLRNVIINDSIIITGLQNDISNINSIYSKDVKHLKRERLYFEIFTATFAVALIISLFN